MTKETGGPAFPTEVVNTNDGYIHEGMTLRQYAAIKLKVPDSGIDWLDDMIRQGLKDEFAAKAMAAYWSDPNVAADQKTAAAWAYDMADAMLKARKE